ncbi:zinc finger protein [Loa loa]|uniref:Zinc finger protein n=1 Tax=Loa loa TaxID=7209 RepID=A0A1S0UCW3_LOALO|nr:zinc finger protein [Loa loa]EJD73429.1 zinc finger protein [Loa loa]
MQTFKEYSKHLETHKEQGLYKCTWSTCGKKFLTSKGLREHYEKHQTKSQCEICGIFSSKRALLKHKRTYHAIRGHTLVDTRNHHIADQSLLGKQDHSGNEYFSKHFNITTVILQMLKSMSVHIPIVMRSSRAKANI